MHNPKFSVIVPAHNSAAYIRRGLDSIRSQTYTDYELIVVCDACTDETATIAAEYADKVIKIDRGLDGIARNAGIDAARGEWLLFMDDDDWFLHEYVFAQLAGAVGKNHEDILFFSFIWKGVGYTRQSKDQMFFAPWCKCCRRKFVGRTRFPPVQYGSDAYFFADLMRNNPKAAAWDMPMYYYNYLRPGSMTWRKEMGELEVEPTEAETKTATAEGGSE